MALASIAISTYAKFRGSVWFLIVLAAIVGFWIIWNLIPGLPHFDDPEFGRLNLALSTEASLSVALLIIAGDKQDRLQRQQLVYMQHLLEAMRDELLARRSDGDAAAAAGLGSSDTTATEGV